jgi:murein L,D-transpeptidase YcbB/YkuD
MRISFLRLVVASGVMIVPFAGSQEAGTDDQIRDAFRDRLDLLSTTPGMTIDGEPIAALPLIESLYTLRDYEPAWDDSALIRQLYDEVLRSAEHGLDPGDFHARPLGARLRPDAPRHEPQYRADTEILCTDALARLAVSLRFGKIDPVDLDPAWNFSREIVHQAPVAYFNRVLESAMVASTLETLGPQNVRYRRTQKALADHRSMLAGGGWPAVSDGPVIEAGSSGPRVAELRRRLRITGDLTGPNPTDPEVFDGGLEEAVHRFQQRHGIDADGKVGPRTVEELNIPVETRIDQLRASLERMRWVFRDLPDDFLVADIAGFQAYLFDEGREVWQTRVQVGKPYHATPVFQDTIRYIELNPTWTIPPGILRNETLPAIRRDPSYLGRHNMSVVTSSGEVVDPATIDWAATATGGFPFMIRQEPGPDNALGRVKFMFPNPYMVYLHDTPSQGLFARSERAFSHGCIRTENPFELVELLLADQGWDRARIDEVLASRKTTRVILETPMTVMLLYFTARVDDDGTVQFRRDVYDRDSALLDALDTPFLASPPGSSRRAVDDS